MKEQIVLGEYREETNWEPASPMCNRYRFVAILKE